MAILQNILKLSYILDHKHCKLVNEHVTGIFCNLVVRYKGDKNKK